MIIEIGKFNCEEYKCLLLEYNILKSNLAIFPLADLDFVLQSDLERMKEDDHFYFLVIGKDGVEGGVEAFIEDGICYLEYLNSFKKGRGGELIKFLQNNCNHIKVTIKNEKLHSYYRKYGFKKIRGTNEMFWKKDT